MSAALPDTAIPSSNVSAPPYGAPTYGAEVPAAVTISASPVTDDFPAASVPAKPKKAPQSLTDILVYDPEAIAAFYRKRPFQILFRLIKIFWIALGYLLGLLWDKVTGRQKVNEQKRAEGLREMLTRLGPAYIKEGQALSTRPD